MGERFVSEHAVPGSPSAFLAVGLSVQLTVSQDETHVQYGSSLLGWKQGGWLIGEWPFHLGKPIPCSPGTHVMLRYIYQGRMIGFHSEVLTTQVEPFPFLLLTFPSTVDEVPLRRDCRMPSAEPILLRHVNDAVPARPSETLTPIGGLLIDLSATGCAVLLQRPAQDFLPGMVLRVEFEIVGTGRVGNLAGRVRNIAMQGGETLLGLEFRFDGKETIEYRGWGGSVQKALEAFILRRHSFESP
jgi:c-di-GMP-binding flagellar brake protein YcgR